jgi:hypothetical protein
MPLPDPETAYVPFVYVAYPGRSGAPTSDTAQPRGSACADTSTGPSAAKTPIKPAARRTPVARGKALRCASFAEVSPDSTTLYKGNPDASD